MSSSVIFRNAIEQYHALRAEFEIVRENAYARAESECNGVLLNRRGKAAHVDPYSLFIGNEVRAMAYASPELIEHWTKHPRIPFDRFEREMVGASEEPSELEDVA
ncbi:MULTISPECIES: hypothetical protein [Cryobacterium]|uniref:hypothetical protein n=1 Tax=Cryobacterium TaxID=69578 RepID=UPI000CD44EE5|nr:MULTISPECIES: hypothetical protein [Cryobacterium]POH63614.1 hypothetical protein C3B60_15970 [Cryobacterium zongtaii]TFC44066.1 hypothetical protein E3O57_11535 [Cryobacterium sp. TMN-39-2]